VFFSIAQPPERVVLVRSAMADAKAMLTIKNVLASCAGGTGEMLSNGLSFALQDGPEERHELQAELLKMVTQVLSAAQSEAKLDAEERCQHKADAAETELTSRKAVSASASEALAATQVAAAAQKEKVEESRRQLTWEEEEHKRVEAEDQEKATEVAVYVEAKNEVVGLLQAMAEKGDGEAISTYLHSAKAEPALVSAVRSVLTKEAKDRVDFDLVAMTHLKNFFETKVADFDAQLQVVVASKVNIHAEALGAWAVKEIAGENVRDAIAELETADNAVTAAQESVREAKQHEEQQEFVLSQALTDLTLAGERARQCNAALEVLDLLMAGPMVAATPVVTAMEVDAEMAAVKMDSALDVEMGTAITA